MVEVVKGQDAIWHVEDYDVVLVGTSIYNMLSNGFQSKMRVKYPIIEEADATTGYGDMRKLGKRITIDSTKPIISILYIAKHPRSVSPLDYEALEVALRSADEEFAGKRVMTTMLGCSPFDGRGDRKKVLQVMKRAVSKMDLTVYDYKQLHKRDEYNIEYKKLKGTDMSLYDKFMYIRNNLYIEWWNTAVIKKQKKLNLNNNGI